MRTAAPRATLVCDGSSDRALLPLLRWVCAKHGQSDVQLEWANLYTLREAPESLQDRIEAAVDLYPCDVVFVHRDAEGQGYKARETEIAMAATARGPYIPVIPVRMTEAWLLCDEAAIRFAAGNPSGHSPLGLPQVAKLEDTPDPKRVLNDALWVASELRGRRQRRMNVAQRIHRVAEHVRDFAPLRQLPAFRALEDRVASLMVRWDPEAKRFNEGDDNAR